MTFSRATYRICRLSISDACIARKPPSIGFSAAAIAARSCALDIDAGRARRHRLPAIFPAACAGGSSPPNKPRSQDVQTSCSKADQMAFNLRALLPQQIQATLEPPQNRVDGIGLLGARVEHRADEPGDPHRRTSADMKKSRSAKRDEATHQVPPEVPDACSVAAQVAAIAPSRRLNQQVLPREHAGAQSPYFECSSASREFVQPFSSLGVANAATHSIGWLRKPSNT